MSAQAWRQARARRPSACSRLVAASLAPVPTKLSLARVRRAAARTAAMAHVLRKRLTKALRITFRAASSVPLPGRLCAPATANAVTSLWTSGDASPKWPNTKPLTGSKSCRRRSTGPTEPSAVPQCCRSTFLALRAYSAGCFAAFAATAPHRLSLAGYVVVPKCKVFTSKSNARSGPRSSHCNISCMSGTRPCLFLNGSLSRDDLWCRCGMAAAKSPKTSGRTSTDASLAASTIAHLIQS